MLLYLEGPTREKRSPERDHFCVKQLFPVFTGRTLESLKGTDIRAYIAKRQEVGVSNGTINWARKELEWGLPNAVEGKKLKVPAGRERWLTRDEADRLLRAAGKADSAPLLCLTSLPWRCIR